MEEIKCISQLDERYPERLKKYSGMPKELYVKGNLPDDNLPTAAIVGARMCSAYGRAQAFSYARSLSMAGVQIISGLAHGIDAQGHMGALEGKTPTFAVMGNGPDICYPIANKKLYEDIIDRNGGIISEYPPGTKGKPYYFPLRNRIISALSDVILVVEAKEGSGSLITANYALEQGKSVYAIPGQVNDSLSKGCHKLIYDGAGIAYSPEILLEDWGINVKKITKTNEKNHIVLESDLKLLYSCLDLRPKNLEYLIQKTGFSPNKLSGMLVQLELLGLIKEEGRHYFVRKI